MPVTKEDARRVEDREKFVAALRATPLDVIRATLQAIDAAPAHTDSDEARYKAAYAALSDWEEPRRGELARRIVPLAAVLVIGKANKEMWLKETAGGA